MVALHFVSCNRTFNVVGKGTRFDELFQGRWYLNPISSLNYHRRQHQIQVQDGRWGDLRRIFVYHNIDDWDHNCSVVRATLLQTARPPKIAASLDPPLMTAPAARRCPRYLIPSIWAVASFLISLFPFTSFIIGLRGWIASSVNYWNLSMWRLRL